MLKEYNVYVPSSIYKLGLKTNDTCVLTVIYMRQTKREFLSIDHIAKTLKVTKEIVKRSISRLKEKELIDSQLNYCNTTDYSKENQGCFLKLLKIVHELPNLDLSRKLLLSLILEDWRSGYFCMTNKSIMERINISKDTITRILDEFVSNDWIRIRYETYVNPNTSRQGRFRTSRVIYANEERIYKDYKIQLAKLGKFDKYTKGILRDIEEQIKIEDNLQLNHWVHKRGQTQNDFNCRFYTGSTLTMFFYIARVFKKMVEIKVSHRELQQFQTFTIAFMKVINKIQLLLTIWFSIEIEMPSNLDMEIRMRYISGNRSLSLFLHPIILQKVCLYFEGINREEEDLLSETLYDSMKSYPKKKFREDIMNN